MNVLNSRKLLTKLVFLFSLTTVIGGCGGDAGPEKVSVAGNVTVDDQPVVEGTIAFVSLEGGRTAVTAIKNGAYTISQSDGPYPGQQKVTIQAFEKTGVTITVTKDLPGPPGDEPAIPPGGLKLDEKKQVLPERYNTASELTASLTSGHNADVNFVLTSGD